MAYWSLVILIIPFRFIKKFFLFALVGGLIYTAVVQHIAVNLAGFWFFKPDIFTIRGIPVFFLISWFGVTLVYTYLLYRYPKHQIWTLIFFILWTTLSNAVAQLNNKIYLPMWSVFETLMFAIFSHILLLYALKIIYNIRELGANEDIVEFTLSVLKGKD